MNALLVKTEIRGQDATGFWGCEQGDGRIFFDKEPIKSSIYAQRAIWKEGLANADADLLIAHCRFSTLSAGNEKVNKNNHPHASADHRVALVHNGTIPEYNQLKLRYNLRSECDSEILLRMFESGEEFADNEEHLNKEFPTIKLTNKLAYRLLGLREIFARVNFGKMAVAIGERGDDGSRYLWLLRDSERPLHVVDMRKTLGQIFFCSTADIWRSAVESCPSVKSYIHSELGIIEFQPDQIWLTASEAGKDGTESNWHIRKFKITKTKYYEYKEPEERAKCVRKDTKPPVKVVSRLDDKEEIRQVSVTTQVEVDAKTGASPKKKVTKELTIVKVTPPLTTPATMVDESIESLEIDMKQFDKLIDEIQREITKISTDVRNRYQEGSFTAKDFETLLDSLRHAKDDLGQTVVFLRQ